MRCCGLLRSHANRGGSDRAKSENELPGEKRPVTSTLQVPDVWLCFTALLQNNPGLYVLFIMGLD